MQTNDSSLSITAAILALAATYRRQEPPEKDDLQGAIKSVLNTYHQITQELHQTTKSVEGEKVQR